MEFIPLLMFLAVFACLLLGYPVAATLAGVSLLFACLGALGGVFQLSDLGFIPVRIYGIMTNQTLIAVPLFVLMGVMLEKARVAEELLGGLARLFGRLPGGMALAVTIVGALMAASTGIVGATVVTMGLIALPTMLRAGYDPRLATGTICATGTLGQIIPPSIALVLLGDVISSSYQQAQISQGIFNPKTVSVGHLFAGSLFPGLLLVGLYAVYTLCLTHMRPALAPPLDLSSLPAIGWLDLVRNMLAPLLLIVAVLGSILGGLATPTEAAGLGAIGAALLAGARKALHPRQLAEMATSALVITAMVFFILIGASIFSLVFRTFGGEELIQGFFEAMPGGVGTALLVVMAAIFLLGFVLDFIEIIFVIVPIVGPILLAMGLDPVWLGILIAVNIQTSFLTPPFGFALFYLRGVAPEGVRTSHLYSGVVPFILLQLLLLFLLVLWPELATWLPGKIFT